MAKRLVSPVRGDVETLLAKGFVFTGEVTGEGLHVYEKPDDPAPVVKVKGGSDGTRE